MKRYMTLALASATILGTAGADPLRDAAQQAVECRAEADTLQRFACLEDAAINLEKALTMATVTAAAPAGAQAMVDTTPVPEATPEDNAPFWAAAPEPKPKKVDKPKKNRFAFIPGIGGDKDKAAKDDSRPDEYEVNVVKVTESAGELTFYTADGQVWRQSQTVEVKLPRDMPTTAVIKRRATGNPTIQFPNRSRSYKVMRIK